MKLCSVRVIVLALLLLATWKPAQSYQQAITSPDLTNIYFANVMQGWLLGSRNGVNSIYATGDGGKSWTEQYKTKVGLLRVRFANQLVGWVVGGNGTILHTSDGGSTWEPQVSGSAMLLTGLAIVDPNTAWVSGAKGTLLFTRDGGKTWDAAPVSTNVGISDVTFADPQHGLAVGYGIILSTSDSGNTWIIKSSSEWKHLSSVELVDACRGWIAVGPAVLRTDNGGNTLQALVPPSQGQVIGINFVDAQHGWVAKSRGEEGDVAHIKDLEKLSSESFILSTSDGGMNWHQMLHIKSEKDHSAWILDIFFIDLSSGWAVGRNGLLLKTVNGGKDWKKINLQLMPE